MIPLVQRKKWKKDNMKKSNYSSGLKDAICIQDCSLQLSLYSLINFTGPENYKMNHNMTILYDMWRKREYLNLSVE